MYAIFKDRKFQFVDAGCRNERLTYERFFLACDKLLRERFGFSPLVGDLLARGYTCKEVVVLPIEEYNTLTQTAAEIVAEHDEGE